MERSLKAFAAGGRFLRTRPGPELGMKVTPRRIKIIRPRIQLRLVGSFVGLAALALLLQFLLLGQRLMATIQGLDGASGALADQVPRIILETLGFSGGILVPILFVFGILLTFRIAGPLYRFEQYLTGLARGEVTGPCKLRDGDELQSMCDLINELSAELRSRRAADAGEKAGGIEADSEDERKVA